MSTLTGTPQRASFAVDVPLDGITPEQMASCLAAGAATAPTLIDRVTATHQTGVVVTVYRDTTGRFDPAAPVFTVTKAAVAS